LSKTFKVATGSFTVTQVLAGAVTNLAFRPRGGTTGTAFVFFEDALPRNNQPGQFQGVLTVGQSISLKPGASINGRVFNDKNATGFFDGDDEGISGFRVFLDSDFDGVLDPGETSKPVSATGTYKFTGIPAGTYRVREVFREGWRQSFPALGYYQVTLKLGEAAKSQSFANTTTVVIKGKVWHDTNKDGLINNGEGGIPGWVVYLDLNHDNKPGKGDDWVLTDANGNYRFSNFAAGTYRVGAAPVAGWKATTSAFKTVTLGSGGTASNKNFGEKRLK
jgi:hypothetical protein